MTVAPGPDPAREGGRPALPDQVRLAWAEDVGWSIAIPDSDNGEGVVRYLHLDLVPPPDVVAGFLAAVLLDGDDVGMPYPATFRLRSQPLQPVLEALTRHSPTPRATPVTTTPRDTPSAIVLRAAPGPSPAYAVAV